MFQVCIEGRYFLLHIGENGKYDWGARYAVFDKKPLPGISLVPESSAPQELISFASKQKQVA